MCNRGVGKWNRLVRVEVTSPSREASRPLSGQSGIPALRIELTTEATTFMNDNKLY